MERRSNFLDADDNTSLEQNLRFVRNDLESDLQQFFGGSNAKNLSTSGNAPPRDYKVVTPNPGFCLKTYKINTEEKYFINVCQSSDIPAPEDITEEQLSQILSSATPSSYRIPMSLSDPRVTKDKSGNPVDACDIAIHPQFFAKITKSRLFKEFFLALISEALSEKYNVQLSMEKSFILNHRKFIGTLVQHRVRNRDVQTVLSTYENPTEADKQKLDLLKQTNSGGPTSLIQEVDTKEVNMLKQKSADMLQKKTRNNRSEISLAGSRVPEYKLRAKLHDEQVEELQVEFHLPKCISSQDFILDIGEDRILLESVKRGYIFDKFVNYRLNQERARAIFDKANKMLQVRIPVYPVQ